uniref:Uncharacterized protein n=1 Tax=Oryza rufipogon TaxID=4529 RepID=A0A0E0PJ90_ORYRU
MENLQALHFEDCQGISVMGNTLKNSHESHLKFTRCSHDKANYMRITSPEDSPDTTGVHVVSSRNVHIMDDSISTFWQANLPVAETDVSFEIS